jgi:DNA-binding transcriptional regulator YiaG
MVYNYIMTPSELKAWRDKNNFKQAALARALDVTPQTMYRWEAGKREIPSFLALALKALECEKKEVKKGKGTKKTKKEV